MNNKNLAEIRWHSPPTQVSKNGHWRVRYGWRDSQNKDHQSTETLATRAECNRFVQFLDRQIAKKKETIVPTPQIKTVGELVRTYSEIAKNEQYWSAKTYASYLGLIKNYIEPQLANVELWRASTSEINRALDRIKKMSSADGNHTGPQKPVSARTVFDCVKILRKTFRWAVAFGVIEPANNPMVGVSVSVPKNERRNVLPESLFFAALEKAKKDDSQMYLLLVLAVMLSARTGELLALRWDDCAHDDAGRPIIHINKTLTTCDKRWSNADNIITVLGNPPSTTPNPRRVWALKRTKTGAETQMAADYNYITPEVEALLNEHQIRQKNTLKATPDSSDMHFIFAQPNGWPLLGIALKNFRQLLTATGCKTPEIYDLYSLRHFSVTKKLDLSGHNYSSVAQDTKHREIETMIKYYDMPAKKVRQNTSVLMSKELLQNKKLDDNLPDDVETEQLIRDVNRLLLEDSAFRAQIAYLVKLAKNAKIDQKT